MDLNKKKVPQAKKKSRSKAKVASKKKTTSKSSKKKNSSSKSSGNWTFPKNSLEDALRIARAIEDKNAGNPMRADQLVKAVGFNKTSDWRFSDLLRSANLYGLVIGSGATAQVKLQPIGEDIVAPSSPDQRKAALLDAFNTVDQFKSVAGFYGDKSIPEDEYFENTLVRDFGVSRDRVSVFMDVFRENLQYLKMYRPTTTISSNENETQTNTEEQVSNLVNSVDSGVSERTREFLDTCFVMMPFGGWFDTYYKDIYVPAVKDAGFEPIRGDEIFTTGSVMEQIWEEVEKASVLLADLTGKNANVFYELGLAHAAIKPVILTANSIDDVPFDLRHLRVITYDTQAPDWSAQLRKSVTEYLKSARNEPAKSIPQPFREKWLDVNDHS